MKEKEEIDLARLLAGYRKKYQEYEQAQKKTQKYFNQF